MTEDERRRKERARERTCVKTEEPRGPPSRCATQMRWCYVKHGAGQSCRRNHLISVLSSPGCLIIYRSAGAHRGSFFFSFFLSFSVSLVSSHPRSSLFTSSLVLVLLSTFPSLLPKIFLPHRSSSLLSLHSVLVSSRYPVHVQSEIYRKDRDKELLIFFDISMFIFNDAPGFLICVIGLSDVRVAFNFPMSCRQV